MTQKMNDTTTTAFTLARHPLDLRFRRAVLADRRWLTGGYVRVRLEGAELDGFASLGCDDHMRLFFPAAPVGSVEELRASPSREYTPLAWGAGWLDVEFAIHGAEGARGVAAEWAAAAPLGAQIGIGGPRGSMVVEGRPDWWFLAGDETAVPAMRRFAASMPADARGSVLVEVPGEDSELRIDTPAGVIVSYVHRGDRPGGSGLIPVLEGLDATRRPPGDAFVFVAAEQSVVKPARALAVDRWGLRPDRIVVKGYWKRGDAAFHAPH